MSRLLGALRRRFTSPLHDDTRIPTLLGLGLGMCFTLCFLTGLYSHALQNPPSWFSRFPRPAGLYRVTQGIHVATGLATIPLLLAKLWTVFPKLFAWPPFRGLPNAIERIMLVPLVGGALFLLLSGVNNINAVYPYPFGFRSAHYAAAWITIGALVVHVGAKAGATRTALRRERSRVDPAPAGLTRRGFLAVAFATSGLVTVFTLGQTVAPLRRLALLAPRRPDVGPQGFPVNRRAADVGLEAVDVEAYRLVVDGPGARSPFELTYDELRSLPQRSATLPIACVEGWSVSKRWTGVPVRSLLELAGAREGAALTVISLQQRRNYRRSDLEPDEAADPDALLALEVEGHTLHPDHGFPARLIAPNRPGVLQTKWVTRLEVS